MEWPTSCLKEQTRLKEIERKLGCFIKRLPLKGINQGERERRREEERDDMMMLMIM